MLKHEYEYSNLAMGYDSNKQMGKEVVQMDERVLGNGCWCMFCV